MNLHWVFPFKVVSILRCNVVSFETLKIEKLLTKILDFMILYVILPNEILNFFDQLCGKVKIRIF